MHSDELEKRIEELESKIAALRERSLLPPRGIRWRARWSIGKLPLYEIALGADARRRERRGRARAVIAVGDVALGVLAIGGYARGVVAIGGLAAGLLSLGGLSLGLIGAAGGLAVGAVSVGGVAAGAVTAGVSSAGYYACGATTAAVHVVTSRRLDGAVGDLLKRSGLLSLCPDR